MKTKLCKICGNPKNIDDFPLCDGMVDGHRNECKVCSNLKYYNKDRRRELNLEKDIKNDGEKICRLCNNKKSISEFHLKRGTSDGHRSECKECIKGVQEKYKSAPNFNEKRKEYDKKRYEKLQNETIERMKQYRIDNKDDVNKKAREKRKLPHIKQRYTDYNKKYTKEHKDELKEYRQNNREMWREISRRYRENNPHVVAWRSILHSTLKRIGTKKEGHTIDLLGYSALDLKEHIEKQFTKGMIWENYGDWNIDHHFPVTSFSPNTSVKIVCALSNLKPMWATTRVIDGITYEGNLNKGDKIPV